LLRYALVARARQRVRIVEQLLNELFQMEGEMERFRKAIQSLRFPWAQVSPHVRRQVNLYFSTSITTRGRTLRLAFSNIPTAINRPLSARILTGCASGQHA
jgi:hypothetical protein